MSFLKNAFKQFLPAADAPSGAIVNQVEQLNPVPEWGDDTQLRALAKDYDLGVTKWVFASDLNEFYKMLDAYNETLPSDQQATFEVSGAVSAKIEEWRSLELHVESKNGLSERKGPIHLEGETMLRVLGPQGAAGLRLRCGEHTVMAEYEAGLVNTGMFFKDQNGTWHTLQFGIGNAVKRTFPQATLTCGPSCNY